MFDACPTQARFDLLKQIRRFFLHHGPDLAQAVSRLGGAPAKQRLARCMTLRPPMSGGLAVTPGHSGCANEEVLMNTRQNPLKGLDELAATAVRFGPELCRSDPRSEQNITRHGRA